MPNDEQFSAHNSFSAFEGTLAQNETRPTKDSGDPHGMKKSVSWQGAVDGCFKLMERRGTRISVQRGPATEQ